MIDAFLTLLRVIAISVGVVPQGVTPLTSLAVVASAVAVAAAAAMLMAAVAASTAGLSARDRVHPARSDILRAPVAQSDPAAPGHILRRGPSTAVLAA